MTDLLTIADLPRYEIDPVRGFLPPADPLLSLPERWALWDDLGARAAALLARKELRAAVDRMPGLDPDGLAPGPEEDRAFLILTVLGNGYVWESAPPATMLPPQLAVPLMKLAKRTGRPPITAHAAVVLANWRRLDPTGPIALDNIDSLITFSDTVDERWFYLVTVDLEADGGTTIPELIEASRAVAEGNVAGLRGNLERIGAGIARVTRIFERTWERCTPAAFFHQVRPWLAGWPEPGLVYQGFDLKPIRLAGGSAAQSPLIQAFDASLGVRHPSPTSGPFLAEMRNYMKPKHRAFLEWLDAAPSVARFVADRRDREPALVTAYDAAIDELDRFRKSHLHVAARYITTEAKGDPHAKGTGGTEFGAFLGAARRETQDARIRND